MRAVVIAVGRTTYSVGDRVHHQVFGEGLVVDVRSRDFFDILEIAFAEGVRKVTSIHPQLRKLNGEVPATVQADTRQQHPPEATRPKGSSARAGDHSFIYLPRSQILRYEPEAVEWVLEPPAADGSGVEAFLRHIDALRISRQRGFERLLALNHTRDVERLEHQIRACLRVLREMKGRALLSDEVGLGKTIEAGLILKEYVLRGLVRKVLILVPVSLISQWNEELRHKFDIEVCIFTRGGDWQAHPFVLASLDTAKSARNRRAIAEAGFDMLIVDEAHRLRNHLTQAWKFVNALSLKYLLLLTATPVQNDLRELYNLVTLLRPGTLGTYRSFKREFVVRGDRRLPKNTRKLSRLLENVMIRTTRSSTSVKFPRRHVKTVTLDFGQEERSFYDEVSGFVRRMAHWDRGERTVPWPLLLVVLQKEIGSSTEAALSTLKRAAESRLARARREIQTLVELGESVAVHAKLQRLERLLREKAEAGEKVVVFSQFRRTVEFLERQLRSAGFEVAVFHGSLSARAKDAAVDAFRREVPILLSTEAGGEGRNLQFCRTLVNYDLPWNPMRIEQRIGRIHRIGQKRDVFVYNLAVRRTLEAYVLKVLQEKINMFNLVVGEVDQILGNLSWEEPFETKVFRVWASCEDDADLEKALGDLGDELERARERYEHIKAYDREVFEGLREAAGK